MEPTQFPKILGTATLNEKGQLVIPVEARNTLGLNAGSRVVVMTHPSRPGLMLFKAEDVEAMVKNLADALHTDEDNKKEG
ncbi:MAG: AbrB family transcriptional regulator [Candidatus Saccharibacteria bacterium]|nr:AbrB family transcriptional regulator [Candidatus Saccharibacteria bacterium]